MIHELHHDQPPRPSDLTPDQRAALEQRIRERRARARQPPITGSRIARQQPADPSATFDVQQFAPQDDRPRRTPPPAAGRRTMSLTLLVAEAVADMTRWLRASLASIRGRKHRRGGGVKN
ncbi:MAG: hypothetical protein IT445_06895 [Phycisphaeraceae bacterium]|nr:hypothetical protein [Phycisphaeraceae bacterium]